jgi:hypothetical protein
VHGTLVCPNGTNADAGGFNLTVGSILIVGGTFECLVSEGAAAAALHTITLVGSRSFNPQKGDDVELEYKTIAVLGGGRLVLAGDPTKANAYPMPRLGATAAVQLSSPPPRLLQFFFFGFTTSSSSCSSLARSLFLSFALHVFNANAAVRVHISSLQNLFAPGSSCSNSVFHPKIVC